MEMTGKRGKKPHTYSQGDGAERLSDLPKWQKQPVTSGLFYIKSQSFDPVYLRGLKASSTDTGAKPSVLCDEMQRAFSNLRQA